MITDSILKFFSLIYQFIIGLVPKFSFLESLVSAKNEFVDFISSFVSYSLYLFNVRVLRLAITCLIVYLSFLAAEYLFKLGAKYLTNLL